MTTTEHNGLLVYVDESGNKKILYPITKAELVEGLDEMFTVATYTANVDTSWSENSAGGFFKTITVGGMTADDNPIVDVVLGDDMAANALYVAAWGQVMRIVTAANSVTLYASGAPTTAFTIQMKVVR